MDDKNNVSLEHYHSFVPGYFEIDLNYKVSIFNEYQSYVTLYSCLKCGALVNDYCAHTRYRKERNE